MEPMVTLTLTLSAGLAQQVLELVKGQTADDRVSQLEQRQMRTDGVDSPITIPFQPGLGMHLDGKLQSMVQFIVSKDGRFFNDELAKLLQIDDPLTSLYLGQLTKKLRKIGARADGFRGAANWYTKRRSSGRTLLTVRPDVLEIMKETSPKL